MLNILNQVCTGWLLKITFIEIVDNFVAFMALVINAIDGCGPRCCITEGFFHCDKFVMYNYCDTVEPLSLRWTPLGN